jgi:hypothetical protein
MFGSTIQPSDGTKRHTVRVFRKAHGGRPRKCRSDDDDGKRPRESQETAWDCVVCQHATQRKGFVYESRQRVVLVSRTRMSKVAQQGAKMVQQRSSIPSRSQESHEQVAEDGEGQEGCTIIRQPVSVSRRRVPRIVSDICLCAECS